MNKGGDPAKKSVLGLASAGEWAARPADVRAAAGDNSWREAFRSLRNPVYRTYWGGMICSYSAYQMSFVARGFLAYELGGTATAVGLMGLSRGLTGALLALPGGATADRMDRRLLLLVTLTLTGALLVVNAILNFADVISLWQLALLMVGEGALMSFNWPVRQAIIPQIVPREDISNAVALHSVAMNLAGILGPAVAGILIGVPFVGVGGALLIIGILFGISVIALAALPPQPVSGKHRSIYYEAKAGFRYISGSPVLFALVMMAVLPMLLGMPYYFMLPVFQEEVFDVGSAALGAMYTVTAVGAVVGSFAVVYLERFKRKAKVQFVIGIVFALSLFLFAVAGSFALALPALVLLGLASNAYMTTNNTLVLVNAESSHHGRISSYLLISRSLIPAFTLPLGLVSDALSPAFALGGAGVIILAFLLVFSAFSPSYKQMAARV